MEPKKIIKDQVELALIDLHEKIDSLRAKVDKLCESTEECRPPQKCNSPKDDK